MYFYDNNFTVMCYNPGSPAGPPVLQTSQTSPISKTSPISSPVLQPNQAEKPI